MSPWNTYDQWVVLFTAVYILENKENPPMFHSHDAFNRMHPKWDWSEMYVEQQDRNVSYERYKNLQEEL